jgi:hypothetical protein
MKIGFEYRSFEDCVIVLYAFNNFAYRRNDDSLNFSFQINEDEFIFSKNYSDIKDCDLKIRLFHTFREWKEFRGYDKLIQTQIVENYHEYNQSIKEYLDAGNICISAASISFEHPNFYYDPIFNLIFFYHFYGFNFLNYYKFEKKENLLGVYYRPTIGTTPHKEHRESIYLDGKEILQDDLVSYNSIDYNLKKILQPYNFFGLWGNNHITSYIDYTTSVCNLIFETLHSNSNEDGESDRMYKRQYITEKTLKAICFSEENIFFIWYGPKKLFKYLNDLGFWFLNSEFFDETKTIEPVHLRPYYNHMEASVKESMIFLKFLKNELKDNKSVHEHLIKLYGDKLKKNSELFNKILNNYTKSDSIINLIKNGKRN